MRRYHKIVFLICFLAFSHSKAQNLILNGSFENNLCNSAGTGVANMINHEYDSLMAYSHSFGTEGNLDVFNLASGFCGAAEDGIWYVALTSGGTDAFSLKLSSLIIQGNLYSLTFYGRADSSYAPGVPIRIGVSDVDSLFGSLIYTSSTPVNCQWLQWNFSFTAPINAQYLTVTCGGSSNVDSAWVHVDNFILDTGSTAGINNITHNQTISLYPNPNNGSMLVEYSIVSDAVIQINDVAGKVVGEYNLSSLNNKLEIHNDNLLNGVYLYRIMSNNTVLKTGKIVIMK